MLWDHLINDYFEGPNNKQMLWSVIQKAFYPDNHLTLILQSEPEVTLNKLLFFKYEREVLIKIPHIYHLSAFNSCKQQTNRLDTC